MGLMSITEQTSSRLVFTEEKVKGALGFSIMVGLPAAALLTHSVLEGKDLLMIVIWILMIVAALAALVWYLSSYTATLDKEDQRVRLHYVIPFFYAQTTEIFLGEVSGMDIERVTGTLSDDSYGLNLIKTDGEKIRLGEFESERQALMAADDIRAFVGKKLLRGR